MTTEKREKLTVRKILSVSKPKEEVQQVNAAKIGLSGEVKSSVKKGSVVIITKNQKNDIDDTIVLNDSKSGLTVDERVRRLNALKSYKVHSKSTEKDDIDNRIDEQQEFTDNIKDKTGDNAIDESVKVEKADDSLEVKDIPDNASVKGSSPNIAINEVLYQKTDFKAQDKKENKKDKGYKSQVNSKKNQPKGKVGRNVSHNEDSPNKRSKVDLTGGKGVVNRYEGERLMKRISVTRADIVASSTSDDDSVLFKRRKKDSKKGANFEKYKNVQKVVKTVTIPDRITAQDLAHVTSTKVSDILKIAMKAGIVANINYVFDGDIAELIVSECGHIPKRVSDKKNIEELYSNVDGEKLIKERAPIVTVMGHVDHGKTSLLDALRSTDVVLSEYGGITQKIGAYKVRMTDARFITFLDTPGHEAFASMRLRGANVTDVVVLVVAADEGIKAQTVEAIGHARLAKVPVIVAVNKIDKVGANMDMVKNSLLEHNIVSEDMGGDVMFVGVSAKNKTGLKELEEAILLQAEFLNLSANFVGFASGMVLEAKVSRERGIVASCLVQNGVLKVGDHIVAGTAYGKIRAMYDDVSREIGEVGPSSPVEIMGFKNVPVAGDRFFIVKNEDIQRQIIEYRSTARVEGFSSDGASFNITEIFDKNQKAEKLLLLVIKADLQGSIDAIIVSIEKMQKDHEVKLKVLHSGIGNVSESDVMMAAFSKATIMAFNVKIELNAKKLAQEHGIQIKTYNIIYNLLDDMKSIQDHMMTPVFIERVLGVAEVRKVFDVSNIGKIAGCYVKNGTIRRKDAFIRVVRKGVLMYDKCPIKSIQRGKNDAKEVTTGVECGICLSSCDDIMESDILECFELVEKSKV